LGGDVITVITSHGGRFQFLWAVHTLWVACMRGAGGVHLFGRAYGAREIELGLKIKPRGSATQELVCWDFTHGLLCVCYVTLHVTLHKTPHPAVLCQCQQGCCGLLWWPPLGVKA
jgi:uncharacterized membrane protein